MHSRSAAPSPVVFLITFMACAVPHAQAESPSGTSDNLITDFSVCKPAEALSTHMEQGKWQRIAYETADFAGTMVGALSFVHAPELTLPLGRSGWHRVYIGHWNPEFDWDGHPWLRVRLSDQPAFHNIQDATRANVHHATHLREVFFASADLTGRDLVFGKANGPLGQKAYYAYVRLEPMTPDEVEQMEQDRADTSTRILTAANDGLSFFHWGAFRTEQDLLSLVEPYRHSDVGRILWAVSYGERVNYPSKTPLAVNVEDWNRGGLASPGDGGSYIEGEKQMHDSLLALQEQGIVPQRRVAEHARSMGIRCCAMLRLGILGPIPQDPQSKRLVSRHPEFRQILKDGTPVEKASYAFPEVRQLNLDIIRECTAGLGLDGVNLCFVRGPQFTRYEQPVLDAFSAKYGKDAREVDPDDPGLLKIRCGFMTDLIRGARGVLDEIGEARSQHLELSIWAWPTSQGVWMGGTPIQEGLDIKAWIVEGLLDDVIFQEGADPECQELCKQHGCTFTLFTGYRGDRAMNPGTVTSAYQTGVERFAFWDIPHRQISPTDWAWLRRVGHREEMAQWDPNPYAIRRTQLHRVGGADVLKSLDQAAFSGG